MRRTALALLLTVAASCPAPLSATPTDFNFSDVELSNIFQTIAVLGRYNVIIDPQVARAKMTVSLKQVEPLDAMFLVAKIQELRCMRVKWEEGSTVTTYAIGRPDKMEKGFTPTNAYTIQLKFARAADVEPILSRHLSKQMAVAFDHDPRTNRLLCRGRDLTFEKIFDLVRDLDLPATAVSVRHSLQVGSPGALTQIWTGTSTMLPAQAGGLHVSSAGSKPGAAWRVTHLNCETTQRTNPDTVCTISVAVEATLEKAEGSATVMFREEVQTKDGEEVVVGTVEISPGEVVQLRIRPEIQKRPEPPPQPPEPPQPEPQASPGGIPPGDLQLDGL